SPHSFVSSLLCSFATLFRRSTKEAIPRELPPRVYTGVSQLKETNAPPPPRAARPDHPRPARVRRAARARRAAGRRGGMGLPPVRQVRQRNEPARVRLAAAEERCPVRAR